MRRFRQAFCALKEHSFVSYAKVATFGRFCDLDLTIVKATAPDDLPLPEKYIHELLNIFSISSSSFHSFSLSFSRRFGRTHCWKVALKCLLLLHRLLRSLPDYCPFRAELLYARSNGLLSLYPCHFRDHSSSNPEDYTMFIRSYAQLLHEALDCFSFDGKVTEEEVVEEEKDKELPKNLKEKMKEADRILEVLQQLQSLIDRVMDCRPTEAAAKSFIVQSAMKYIIRDSFICYTSFRKEIVLVMDHLIQMPYKSCILSFGIYKKAALQAEQLCDFYDWCKAKGLCGSHEHPFIEKIPEIQIRALGNFLNGMWQPTESSSSATSPSSWVESNKSCSTEDDETDSNKQMDKRNIIVSTQWVKFEENYSGLFQRKIEENKEEMAPLIQLEDGENDDWEVLLDASLHLSRNIPLNNHLLYPCTGFSNGYGCEVHGKDSSNGEKNNQWQLQVYNPNNYALNPFSQPYYYMPNCYEWYHGSNPACPWGL
ncbi:hypothetical protein GH714_007559 [Hevea brasiliensis]|uniref:ENTH domain-containing protein n=1 Tax=Hevea brasiliensis TaxID=3981 RepID=A0A6A6LW59_HEVBR|nr:hypothetical protein GH714_007505 [Hevea brasiliensis]KAF2305686.1 hypothetical protein GH714_007559 [Hevea brasiliensis]